MEGYAIFNKKLKVITKHAVRSNVDYFPMMIFETLSEAKKYVMYDTEIRKLNIVMNKTNLNR